MTTKSPTTSVKSREIIGEDQFTQRREVFDKYDTVFLPLPSPTNTMAYKEVQPIVTSNHGKTTNNFKRNSPACSSMRESRTEDRNIEFRTRKYSDNFTSELNQSDDVDYRHSMTERTRRISILREKFLKGIVNPHEPTPDSPFARAGTRASIPVKYKIESPNLHKFPFAEPYPTPPPVRKIQLDLGPAEVNGKKEEGVNALISKHQSLPNNNTSPKVNRQIMQELLKRYSPERMPIDWKLPPTRPRVVGSVPKSTSSMADSVDNNEKKVFDESLNKSEDDDVFVQNNSAKENVLSAVQQHNEEKQSGKGDEETKNNSEIKLNGIEILTTKELLKDKPNDSKSSLAELEEKNDEVPELSIVRPKDTPKRPSIDNKYTDSRHQDLSIPALIEKMTEEGEDLENHKNDKKKVKRKRSFLDKLLGRNKKEK